MQHQPYEQYPNGQSWSSEGPVPVTYYNNQPINESSMTEHPENRFGQGYLPPSGSIKSENVTYPNNSVQWTQNQCNAYVDTESTSGSATYKEWKLKFSCKDSNGFHCLLCAGKSFTADSSLKRHYKQSHEKVCKTCHLEFSDDNLLSQHIKENHEFSCSICFKVFSASSSLKRHHDQQHGGSLPEPTQHPGSSVFQAQSFGVNEVS